MISIVSQLLFFIISQTANAPQPSADNSNLLLFSGSLQNQGESLGHIRIFVNQSVPLLLKQERSSDGPSGIEVEFKQTMIANWTKVTADYEIFPDTFRIVLRFRHPRKVHTVEMTIERINQGSFTIGSARGYFLDSKGNALLGNIVRIPFAASPDQIARHPNWPNLIQVACEANLGGAKPLYDPLLLNNLGE